MSIAHRRCALLNACQKVLKRSPLGGEIEHFMTLDDREYAYDEVSALFDAYALAEQETKDRRIIDAARTLLIEVGFYRVMPDEEIADTFMSSGRSPWNFKRGGVAYVTDFNTDSWQWPEEPQ